MEFGKHLVQTTPPVAQAPPAEPDQLERFFTASQAFGQHFRPCPTVEGAYRVEWNDRENLVTFSAELANERPDTLRLFTFGGSLFEQLLHYGKPPDVSRFGLVRMEDRVEGRLRIGWYGHRNGQATPISSLSELIEVLDRNNPQPGLAEQAQRAFESAINKETRQHQEKMERINKERNSVALQRGRYLLTEACYVWAARHRTLFDTKAPPLGDATLESMTTAEGYPWAPLRRLVGDGIRLSSDSDRWQEITTRNDHQLTGLWQSLNGQAEQVVSSLAEDG